MKKTLIYLLLPLSIYSQNIQLEKIKPKVSPFVAPYGYFDERSINGGIMAGATLLDRYSLGWYGHNSTNNYLNTGIYYRIGLTPENDVFQLGIGHKVGWYNGNFGIMWPSIESLIPINDYIRAEISLSIAYSLPSAEIRFALGNFARRKQRDINNPKY